MQPDTPSSHAAPRIKTYTPADLIRIAEEYPPEVLIDGLVDVGEIVLLHGQEESFKSVFVLECADSLASGTPLLRVWNVPRPRTVGVVETEIHEARLGQRLAKMFPNGGAPDRMRFFSGSEMRQFRRLRKMDLKMAHLGGWVHEQSIEVLMIDTANDFFRGDANPSDETVVGEFFDRLRNLGVTALAVRHDRKTKADDMLVGNPNERIRGSAEWKEDPEVILSLVRKDRRTNEARFEVGKLRYASKPEPLTLWFDAQSFRLIPLPPVIAMLEGGAKLRQELVGQGQKRFGLGERKVDEMTTALRHYLRESQQGHQKLFELDPERLAEAEWFPFLRPVA